MKNKNDRILCIFFKPSEIKKIKKVDKMHAKKVISVKKVDEYINRYRITSYVIFTLLTLVLVLGIYILHRFDIYFTDDIFKDFPLFITRILPIYFLILILLELFIIYNKIYEVKGTIFNKQIKKCFVIAIIHLLIITCLVIYLLIVYKNKDYIKTDLLILLFAIFYIAKSAMDIIGFARMYLKSKIV